MADRIETLLAAERRLLLDISHELRSPLARLGVAIELARSGDDTDSALNRIQKESDRLNSLVGQLLQVTRAEGDPASLHHDLVRLDQLVQQLVDDSAIEAAAHGCSLQYQSAEPVTIAGDPELLRRAVENVLRNAIRYAPRDTTVEVRLSAAAKREPSWRSAIAARASRKRRCRASSTPSTAWNPIATGSAAASGWASPSPAAPSNLHKGAIRAANANPGLQIDLEFPVA